jgi:hypothetical protein
MSSPDRRNALVLGVEGGERVPQLGRQKRPPILLDLRNLRDLPDTVFRLDGRRVELVSPRRRIRRARDESSPGEGTRPWHETDCRMLEQDREVTRTRRDALAKGGWVRSTPDGGELNVSLLPANVSLPEYLPLARALLTHKPTCTLSDTRRITDRILLILYRLKQIRPPGTADSCLL